MAYRSVLNTVLSVMTPLVMGVSVSALAMAQSEEPGVSSTQGIDLPIGGDTVTDQTIATEYVERMDVSSRLTAHDHGLLGDSVDLNTGSVSFHHVDVSLPGNSGLEVAIRRSRSSGFPFAHLDQASRAAAGTNWTSTNGFSDWTLEVPEISVVTHQNQPVKDFCSFQGISGMFFQYPGQPASLDLPWYEGYDISNGLSMTIPGAGSQSVLTDPTGVNWPSGTLLVTQDYWAISCGGATNDGATGLIATAPNGTRYHFDRYVRLPEVGIPVTTTFESFYGPAYELTSAIGRYRETLRVTEVEDVHGNWVRYDYDADDRVERIHANDGRAIDINRDSAGLITSVVANGRTWTYNYITQSSNDYLHSVTLPDNRAWQFDLVNMFKTARPEYDCTQADYNVSLTHPDGVTGTFTFRETQHLKGDNPTGNGRTASCQTIQTQLSATYDHMSLISRTLSGPDYPAQTWTYDYSGLSEGAGVSTKWGQVTAPDGMRSRSIYARTGVIEGLMTRSEMYDGNVLVQSTDFDYTLEDPLGSTFLSNTNPATSTRPRHQTEQVLVQEGVTYTTTTGFNTDPASADYSYGRPVSHSASSTLGSGIRTTTVDYEHIVASWILGLPDTVSQNGIVLAEHGYDAFGQRIWTDSFGTRVLEVSYNADGTYAWVEDALNRRTQFANYHRGMPRLITFADGSSVSATVDDNGWISSATNARGITTSYDYTPVGWVSLIDRPSPHADTTVSYGNLGQGTVQTVVTGSQRSITEMNGFHQPLLVTTQPVSGGGLTTYQRTEYDALGRAVFASLPSDIATETRGTETTYDALGRMIEARETMAPYATTTTEYLTGNRTRVTDPLGHVTTTTASGYGAPGDGNTILIEHPEGLNTQMTYDIWGKMLTARQYGTANGYTSDMSQSWVYDDQFRVCRHNDPSSLSTLYRYDAAGQTTTITRGRAEDTSCATSYPPRATITHTYDARGRLSTINYPDSAPDISFGYDANGNMTSAQRGLSQWTYVYDTADALVSETLTIDGYTFTSAYERNANGHLTYSTSPAGRRTSYNPNGLGQARRVLANGQLHASGASYTAAGALAGFTYGNGLELDVDFDDRLLMTGQSVGTGAVSVLDLAYAHNATGQVTDITDHVLSGQDRSFTYDGLGRLVTATGPWGQGSYVYDVLGNLRLKTLGTRQVDIRYGSRNRVSRVQDDAQGPDFNIYQYDSRGNVLGNGRLTWTYDRSDQPVTMSGDSTGSFVYDAHRRRVRQDMDGERIYSVYTQAGTLAYRFNETTGQTTDYLRLAGRTVARITTAHGAGAGTGLPTYLHSDHLGSPLAATDATGAVLWREDFTPFGESRQNPAANDNNEHFTGHIADTNSGVVYMQARYYDPVIGRFLSVDPVQFADAGADHFNRYAYVTNDPLNMVDPDGRESRVVDGRIEITPKDTSVPAVSIPNTVGANGVSESSMNFHDYDVSTDTSGSGLTAGDAGRGFQNNPTPGSDQPASTNGTVNNAGPIPGSGNENLVGSFTVPSPDPSKFTDVTVNYTIAGEHGLNEGFVVRFGEIGPDGTVSALRSYGEGNAWQQNEILGGIWGPQVERVWQRNHTEIIHAAPLTR